jgi:hypothetical protein
MPEPRPDVQMFFAFLNAQPGPQLHEVAAPAARQMLAVAV